MKILYFTVLVAAVAARPEPPVGYNYPSPSQLGNTLDSAQLSINNQPHLIQNLPSQSSSFIGGSTNFGSDFTSHSGGGIINGFSSDSNIINSGRNQALNTGDGFGNTFSGFTSGSGVITSGLNQFQNGASDGFGSGQLSGPGVITSGPTLVHKHVYVHVAPEEPEEIRQRKPIVVGAPQKHYKIIFIKAPAPPKPVVPIIPVQPQNEEKTLVYVLVKKPEDAPEINIPTPIPTQPSKPEVYFIKYNTKKEKTAINAPISSQTGGNQLLTAGHSLTNTGGNQLLTAGHSLTNTGSNHLSTAGHSLTNTGGNQLLTVGDSLIGTEGHQSSTGILSQKYGPPGYQN